MIYFYCGSCGLKFRKSRIPETKCICCGDTSLLEEDIPNSELTDVDDMFEEIVRENMDTKQIINE